MTSGEVTDHGTHFELVHGTRHATNSGEHVVSRQDGQRETVQGPPFQLVAGGFTSELNRFGWAS
jgi:hypothetical protein